MKLAITMRGKRWAGIAAITLVAIAAVVDIIHDFVTNDPVHYFSEQPRRLLSVAAIAIAGGLITFAFDRLSLRLKRIVKLFALGSLASCLTALSVYFLSRSVQFSSLFDSSEFSRVVILVPVCFGVVAAVLWFEFFQTFKKRAP